MEKRKIFIVLKMLIKGSQIIAFNNILAVFRLSSRVHINLIHFLHNFKRQSTIYLDLKLLFFNAIVKITGRFSYD